MIYCWGESLKEFSKLNPNYLLLWEIIKYGCKNGYKYLDFGRSQPNTGIFFFKEGWGAKPKQLLSVLFS